MLYSKIGEVEFSATTEEDVTYESEVTDHPVEDLGYISDHVKPLPIKFSIAGVVVGEDAFPKLKLLREYCKGKKVYRYYGRNIFSNVVIESLSTSHSGSVRNGFSFKISCKIIKQAVSKQITNQAADPLKNQKSGAKKTATQTKKVKNKGKQIKTKRKVDQQKKLAAAKKYTKILSKNPNNKRMFDKLDSYLQKNSKLSGKRKYEKIKGRNSNGSVWNKRFDI